VLAISFAIAAGAPNDGNSLVINRSKTAPNKATGIVLEIAAPAAFIVAAAFNYLLSIAFVFRHKAKWNAIPEIGIYQPVLMLRSQ